MEKITLHGRRVYKGNVKGEALVSHEGISTYRSINLETGEITARGHDLQGKVIKGKVLVFPFAKGSSAWGNNLHEMAHCGATPLAMLVTNGDTRSAVGAVCGKVPCMTDFDVDPTTVIETGDWVEVNADEGIVVVTKKKNE